MPRVSIVLPVHNRDRELRRALRSVLEQSFTDFECVVVDDASTVDVGKIVDTFEDARLRVVRREENGGPSEARFDGYRSVRGEYVIQLDSDWEFYPWVLERGCDWLERRSDVDIVCALHLRHEDSRMFVRVRDAPRLITPEDFRRQEPIPDRVAMVRRVVVDEWLALPGKYFALEAQQWITAELAHRQIALDEPWVRYHTRSSDRVTTDASAGQRKLDDFVTFLRVRGDLIDGGPCRSVDWLLENGYIGLRRNRRPEASLAAAALRRRGIRPSVTRAREIATRFGRRLRLVRDPEVTWV